MGNEKNIIDIIEILKEYNFLHLISICPTILAHGKSNEIKSILDLLSPYEGIIENEQNKKTRIHKI